MTDIQQMITPSRVGQSTAVEQARAVAEVQAAIIVARQFPRDVQQAIRDMETACRRMSLAERAFFRYNRGDGVVTGPSVYLARELATCWCNVQHGINEMRRDDEFGQSEMQAWAWDVERNTRVSNTFIVPHRRDTRNGPKVLTDQRDIYENNANNASRRLRMAIWSVLPAWFTEMAQDLCNKTLVDGGGEPLPQRIAKAIKHFGELGVSEAQIEDKLGNPPARWTEYDVAQLGVIYKSILRGETRKDEEFPPAQARVTASEIIGQPPAPSPAPAAEPAEAATPADDGAEDSKVPGTASAAQIAELEALYASRFGLTKATEFRPISEQIIRRELSGPHKGRVHANLSAGEVIKLRDTLEGIEDFPALAGMINSETLHGADLFGGRDA